MHSHSFWVPHLQNKSVNTRPFIFAPSSRLAHFLLWATEQDSCAKVLSWVWHSVLTQGTTAELLTGSRVNIWGQIAWCSLKWLQQQARTSGRGEKWKRCSLKVTQTHSPSITEKERATIAAEVAPLHSPFNLWPNSKWYRKELGMDLKLYIALWFVISSMGQNEHRFIMDQYSPMAYHKDERETLWWHYSV